MLIDISHLCQILHALYLHSFSQSYIHFLLHSICITEVPHSFPLTYLASFTWLASSQYVQLIHRQAHLILIRIRQSIYRRYCAYLTDEEIQVLRD